jgi:RHS repeat-associated protein
MEMEGVWAAQVGTENAYQYNGKELNEDFGLNLSDYGARWYDAALGRWWSVDPLAEKYTSMTGYHYALNNPVRFLDMFGMDSSDPNTVRKEKRAAREARKAETDVDAKARQNRDTPNFPQAWITNVENTDTKRLISIAEYAADIFSKNGYNGLKINFVSKKESQRHSETYPYMLFLAIRNDELPSSIGNSLIDFPTKGRIGIFNQQGGDRTGWHSYINLGRHEISQRSNPNYSADYFVAHEFLHQMLAYASFYREGSMNRFSHDNSTENLNMDGNYVKVPAGPSAKLHLAERILPHQKEYLDYFLNIKR